MKMRTAALLIALTSAGSLFGCANYEVNTKRGDIPGYFIRTELQESDRAIEAARLAGKDKACPAEFKAAEDAKNNAYDVFRACHTEEGAALAKQATEKANALCPPQAAKIVPAPVAPAPVVAKAPSDNLTVSPESITKGQTATLAWTSTNANDCAIQPGIGSVKTEGAMTITPADNTVYTLICNGAGGTAKSTANIAVVAPAPVVPAARLCSPTIINVQFDTNKSDIKPRYQEELNKLVRFLNEFPNAKGVIEGHTDSDGSKAYNMKLSQRRADSVRNYIVKKGIAPQRISAKGFGPTKPIADNKTKAGKLQNRRIEANFECNGK